MRIKELLMGASLEQAADYFIQETQSDPKIKLQIVSAYKDSQNEIAKITPVESGRLLLDIPYVCDGEMRMHGEIYMREDLLSADVSLVGIGDIAMLSDEEVASALKKAKPLYGEGAALMDWAEALGVEVFLLDERNAGTLAAKLYWEMTFGGQTLDEIKTTREEIFASSAAYAKCKKYGAKDFLTLRGYEMDEVYVKFKSTTSRERLKNSILMQNAILVYKNAVRI